MHVAAGLISLQVKWDYKYVQLAQSVEHRVLQSGQNKAQTILFASTVSPSLSLFPPLNFPQLP